MTRRPVAHFLIGWFGHCTTCVAYGCRNALVFVMLDEDVLRPPEAAAGKGSSLN